jgi:putative MFS transporter
LLASLLTTASILVFLPLSHGAEQHTTLLAIVIVALLISSGAMAAMMSPYAAEVYPTNVRTTGSGLAAGGGSFGGLAGLGAVVAHLTPTLAVAAPLVAIPVALAVLVIAGAGHETRGRRLEETSGEEPGVLTMDAAVVAQPVATGPAAGSMDSWNLRWAVGSSL